MKRLLIIFLLWIISIIAQAQAQAQAQVNLDSLWGVWNDTAQDDTSRIKAMYAIASTYRSPLYGRTWEHYPAGNTIGSIYSNQPDSAIYFLQLQLKLAESVDNKKWMGIALRQMVFLYMNQGNYDKSIDLSIRILKIEEGMGDKIGSATSLNNIGIIYRRTGNLNKALDYYNRALKIREEIGGKKGIAGTLINMGMIYHEQDSFVKAIVYCKRGAKICEEIGEKNYLKNALGALGTIYFEQGEHTRALNYHTRALKASEEIEHLKGIARSLNNIGMIYYDQGNNVQAIDHFMRTLKIGEEMGNQNVIGSSLINIGNIYNRQEDYAQAIDYYIRSLKIQEENRDKKRVANKEGIAESLINIGSIYRTQGDYVKAMDYLTRGVKICEEIDENAILADALNHIALIYQDQGKYALAMDHYTRTLKIREELGDKKGISYSLSGIGEMYAIQGHFGKAISYGNRSLALAQEVGVVSQIKDVAENLYKSYKTTGQYQKALEMQTLYFQMRDSLNSEENQKSVIQQQYRYEYEKKTLTDSLAFVEQELKLNLTHQEALHQKDQIRNIVMSGGLIALILALGLWFRNRFVQKTNKQLAEAKDRAERSERYKQDFLANISHEFRTPLTVIMGMTEELEKNPEEAKKMIFRNSERLLSLINQLLDLSKLESGKLELKWVQGNVIPYLQYLSESFQSFAETKDIQLLFYQEVEELVMNYDEEKVQQIVSNLVSNAIKFTPQKGKVKVHVNARNQNGKEELILKVKDTGMGIEQSTLSHIFDRFYQVGDSHTYKGEGTGIGLALAKEFAEMMQGNISVKSEAGKGTEFTIVLPVSREAEPKQIETPLSMKDMRKAEKAQPSFPLIEEAIAANQVLHEEDLPLLLIIEDNPDVATYIHTCLEGLYRIEKAENGQVGIDKAIEMVPDVIISDVMMPEKDGFEVCNTLKNDERTSHIPIVMLTAKASIEDKLTGLQRGADAYLTKPFYKKELFIRLQKLVELRQQLQKRYNGAALFDPAPTTEVPLEIEDAFLIKLKSILEKHLDDIDYTIPDFCKEAGMSRTQMHRKLKALTDKSATHFIRSFRLRKAKELLQTTDLNVSEIAYDVGFQDPAYFSTSFLEEFGISPSETRK